MLTNGLSARSLTACSARAATSLPTPVSPVISTVDARLCAKRRISALDLEHLRRLAEQRAAQRRIGVAREQRAHLALQLRGLERAVHQDRNVIDVERLRNEVERALGHRLDRALHAGVRGQQDHERVGMRTPDLAQQRQPIGIGQAIVEQHEIERMHELGARGRAGRGFADHATVRAQTLA